MVNWLNYANSLKIKNRSRPVSCRLRMTWKMCQTWCWLRPDCGMEDPGWNFWLWKDVLSYKVGDSPAEPHKHPQTNQTGGWGQGMGHGSKSQCYERHHMPASWSAKPIWSSYKWHPWRPWWPWGLSPTSNLEQPGQCQQAEKTEPCSGFRKCEWDRQ